MRARRRSRLMAAFDRSTMSVIASSQRRRLQPARRADERASSAGRGWRSPPSRGAPSGPSRPWFTRSPARPRTPTIRPPATPMSMPQPVEHRTHTDWTHRSGVVGGPFVDADGPWARHAASGAPRCRRCCPGSRVAAHSLLRRPSPGARAVVSIRCERGLHLVLAVLGFMAALVDQVGGGHDQDDTSRNSDCQFWKVHSPK